MTIRELFWLIYTDLYRYNPGNTDVKTFIRAMLFNKGFKVTFFYRLGHYLYQNNHRLLLFLFRLYYQHLQIKLACELPYDMKIGPGFYFGHVFGTIINHKAVIGANCNMSHGVTIGQSSRGKRKGYPVIGDNVFIGPNASIIGAVQIGDNAIVGTNALIIKDVPESAVVTAEVAQELSRKGSEGYVINTTYQSLV